MHGNALQNRVLMQNSWLERREFLLSTKQTLRLGSWKSPKKSTKKGLDFFLAFAWPLFQTPSNYYSSSFHYADFSFPHLQVALGASTVVQQQQAVGESCCTHQNSLLFRLLATTIVLGEERASSSSFSSLPSEVHLSIIVAFSPFSEMLETPYYIHYSPSRMIVHKMVTSKYFDLAISAVIGLNVITMAMEFYMMPRVRKFVVVEN